MATFIKLATTTLTADATSVEFSDIPAIAEHLYVVGQGKGDLGGNNTNIYFFMNNDVYNSTDNAFYNTRYYSPTTANPTSTLTEGPLYGYAGLMTATSAPTTTSYRGNLQMWILNYTSTSFGKPIFFLSNSEYNSTTNKYHSQGQGIYNTRSPIHSIRIETDQGASYKWKADSTFDLYGIRLA